MASPSLTEKFQTVHGGVDNKQSRRKSDFPFAEHSMQMVD